MTFTGKTELDSEFVKMKADLSGKKISNETKALSEK